MAAFATSPLRVKTCHILIALIQARLLRKKPSLELVRAWSSNIGTALPDAVELYEVPDVQYVYGPLIDRQMSATKRSSASFWIGP